MRIVSYGLPGAEQPGLAVDGGEVIVPLAPLLTWQGLAPETNALLERLPGLAPRIEELAATGGDLVEARSVRLGPPVTRPSKIVVCGVNYGGQVEEARAVTGGVPPRHPPLGIRPLSSLSGPHDPIVLPPEARELDWEAELAVVIGRGGRRIPRAAGWDHVAGLMCAQDLTARDVMLADTDLSPFYAQITRGKSFDTFCPTGPWLVTLDEIADRDDLRIRLSLNGDLRQDASTTDMLHDVPSLVEFVSSSMTLVPGDILLTGTPAGMGAALHPPRFLRAGDVLRTEIEGLGFMENVVEDEVL